MHKAMVLGLAVLAACGSSHSSDSVDGGLSGEDAGFFEGDGGGSGGGGGGSVIGGGGGGSLSDASVGMADGGAISPTDAGPTHDGGVPSETGGVGTPCSSDADCDGRFCGAGSSGVGYCTWVCAADVPCPDDGICVLTAGTFGYCLLGCGDTGSSACPMGTACYSGIGVPAPVCTSGCTDDTECPTGTICGDRMMGYGRCLTPGAENGSACASNDDCPELSFCADEASWGFAGGICIRYGCTVGSDVGCEADTTCVSLGMEGTICLPDCETAGDCRSGYECLASPSGATDVCLPRCSADTDCSDGRHCDFLTARCVDW